MKIISFSLWGENPKYCVGAIKNAELANQIYPDWKCRFYCGQNTDPKCLDELSKFTNCELFIMDSAGDWYGMFWRFFAADGDDTVISRDTDSRLNIREKDAVDAWLESDKNFHIMRDHPLHRNIVMGGMWGARNGVLKGIFDEIKHYSITDRFFNDYMVDQNFLGEIIYPKIKETSIVHDPFMDNIPFPTKRIGGQFVGQPFNADDTEADINHSRMILQSGK